MVGLARGLRPSGYRRVWLARDVVAGVVLSTLLVPQGMAYAELAWAPWYIADADDKKRARLNIISHLLSQVPLQAAGPPGHQTSQTAAVRRLRPAGPALAAHPHTVLAGRHAGVRVRGVLKAKSGARG
jgi:hypothetical protein